MRIASNGNIGIGTNNPTSILQVGGGGRLKIANSANDYTMIGANDTDGATNTRITMFGNTYPGASGFIQYIATSTGDHQFYTGTNATERLRIASNGNIGIGTINPGFRLEVSGGITITLNGTYYGNPGPGSAYNGNYLNVVAKFNGPLWTTDYLAVGSDIRIKEDIQDINDDSALQSILSIQPKTYKYIDKVSKGDIKVYGFIAQQIRDVFPNAVSIQGDFIPNIYSVADYNSCVITLPSQPTKVVIKVDDKIKCYDKDNKELLVEVIEVIDTLTFKIKDIEYSDSEIFVYGTFVDDFHTLDKTYIFTLNVCATQELHRRIEAQSLLIKSQDDRIKELETKMERLLSGTT